MRLVKTSKPPETSAVQAPLARIVCTRARPPDASVRRFAMMRSTTAASRPFSSATRSRKAGSKAISPFIERAVMAATRSLTPISSASSSMHSWSIMVESMSASRIFLRRAFGLLDDHVDRFGAKCCAQRSTCLGGFGLPRAAPDRRRCLRPASEQRLRRPTVRPYSQARPTAARLAGWDTSVAMSGIENSKASEAGEGRVKNAILIAGPTASGKSALALDLAERKGGVIVNTDSMQGYSVLDVLTARPSAAELARAPHCLYGHVHPVDRLFHRRLAARRDEADRRRHACRRPMARLRTAGDFRRRHRALFSRACRGHFGNARHSAAGARPLALRAQGARARPSCTAS